ncbi:MAG: cobyrinate a,c-diamide synthase [Clostridiaceae bacterium]|nr:cobyrinate a,c-diamide synthase [Clostridiaceae bacterium]
MKQGMSRVLFAAPKSGSGKTMLVCGMIEVWKRRGYQVASLKCGPDYIDPMFHRKVLGIPSGNLDTFFTSPETTKYLLAEKAKKADITVMEGVMGYYDGLGGQTDRASTYEIAKITGTPVILVVDAKGASVSLAAMLNGILEYRKDHGICGILFNRISLGYYKKLKELIERECGIEVVGYVPELPELAVPSRHLGLVAPDEAADFEKWIQRVADAVEQSVDCGRIFSIAEKAEPCNGKPPELPGLAHRVRLAVASDAAFSFYYTENEELLKKMGAELVYFSPLSDSTLPENVDGLLLGGGYPEQYAGELERAEQMRRAVRNACEQGMPCLAECGGFLYLQETLEDSDGKAAKMAGVLPGKGIHTDRLCRFGYIEATIDRAGVLGEQGQTIKGHEFHYWDCTENGDGFTAKKPIGETAYPCMVHTRRIAAGFPHFYYYSNPKALFHFLQACEGYQAARRAQEHWDSIAKPIDSLGLLEKMIVRICRIKGDAGRLSLKKRALVVLCADHGVVREGVTQTGSDVTQIVGENFAKGCSTVNWMAEEAGVDVYTVDVGMDTPCYPQKELVSNAVIDRKIARGTGNIAKEPAMTQEQCRQALETGIQLVRELKEKGYGILATGEMGIGNTTPTSVLASVFLQLPPREVTGKGAGLPAEALQKKYAVVERTVERLRQLGILSPPLWKQAPEILAQAGGFEIAVMAGIYLGGVRYRIPIVMDGAISTVAALAAMHLDRRVSDIVLASHVSEERSGALALQALGVEAPVHGRMCLGEGTGAMTLFPLLDMAEKVYQNMGTFAAYEIDAYERYGSSAADSVK